MTLLRKRGYSGRTLVTAVPYLWLLLFFLVPFLIVLKISVSEIRLAMPPYEPLITWISSQVVGLRISFENYAFLFEDSLYWKSFLNSIRTAGISTIICLLIGYPMAYGIARSKPAWRNILLLLVMLPFWTSFLLRVYAWIGILKNNGVINNLLMALGIIDEPIVMLQTNFAMYIGIVYSYLPFMVLPLYTSIEKLDNSLLEAAARSRLPPGQGILQDHGAAYPGRNHRWLHAGFHSRGGRVRDSCAARRAGRPHDRARALGGVLQQP